MDGGCHPRDFWGLSLDEAVTFRRVAQMRERRAVERAAWQVRWMVQWKGDAPDAQALVGNALLWRDNATSQRTKDDEPQADPEALEILASIARERGG